MSDMQAALGLSQLQRLDTYIERRHVLASRYNQLLESLPVMIPWQHPAGYSGLHLYVIRLQLQKISSTRREVFDSMRSKGIAVNLHYIPIYTQPYFQRLGFKAENFPEAERYYAEAISLPMYPTLTKQQQDFVVSNLRSSIQQ